MRRVRGRLKSPDPEKESRWQRELPHSWTAPVLHPHPSLCSYSTSVQKTLWGFEVEECLNAGLVRAASDHKVPADSCKHRAAHFTNTLSLKGEHNSCLWPAPLLLSTKHLTDNKLKTRRREERQQDEENSHSNKLVVLFGNKNP